MVMVPIRLPGVLSSSEATQYSSGFHGIIYSGEWLATCDIWGWVSRRVCHESGDSRQVIG